MAGIPGAPGRFSPNAFLRTGSGMEEARAGAKPRQSIVTYADDLVILCRKGNADQALQQLRKIMEPAHVNIRQQW